MDHKRDHFLELEIEDGKSAISLFGKQCSPENVIKFSCACIQKGIEVNRIWIKSHKLRNAAYDATSLNILSWQEGKLVISDKYSGTFSKSKDNKKIEDILKDEVNQSYFISAVETIYQQL